MIYKPGQSNPAGRQPGPLFQDLTSSWTQPKSDNNKLKFEFQDDLVQAVALNFLLPLFRKVVRWEIFPWYTCKLLLKLQLLFQMKTEEAWIIEVKTYETKSKGSESVTWDPRYHKPALMPGLLEWAKRWTVIAFKVKWMYGNQGRALFPQWISF